jgi:hypothetical protein
MPALVLLPVAGTLNRKRPPARNPAAYFVVSRVTRPIGAESPGFRSTRHRVLTSAGSRSLGIHDRMSATGSCSRLGCRLSAKHESLCSSAWRTNANWREDRGHCCHRDARGTCRLAWNPVKGAGGAASGHSIDLDMCSIGQSRTSILSQRNPRHPAACAGDERKRDQQNHWVCAGSR